MMNFLQILATDSKGKVEEGMNMVGGSGTNASLSDIIGKVTSAIFIILGIVAVFVIILGGFNMMTSAGDPGKVKKGKDTILWGIIGLIIAILAYAIVDFVIKKI